MLTASAGLVGYKVAHCVQSKFLRHQPLDLCFVKQLSLAQLLKGLAVTDSTKVQDL
jgi:hypothetical protein